MVSWLFVICATLQALFGVHPSASAVSSDVGVRIYSQSGTGGPVGTPVRPNAQNAH
jgi:hypothetical protein